MRKIAVLYNVHAGASSPGAGQPLEQRLAEVFTRRGLEPVLRAVEPATVCDDVRTLLAEAPDAVVVAGGDGSVTLVAEHMLQSEVPLGVLPTGTMNLLAHDLGVPEELEAALDAMLTAPVQRMDVARVNGQLFLCSSALAMMPHLGRVRERARGASALPLLQFLARAAAICRRYPRTRLRIVVDGAEHVVRTRAVVVSNNPLSPRSAPLPARDSLDTGRLAVYISQDRTRWDLVGIAAKLIDGSWPADKRIRKLQGRTVQVTSSQLGLISVMSDGEVDQLAMPLRYDIQAQALAVLTPRANR